MNVDNQTLIHVKAGSLPPDDMLKMMLDKIKPNAFGFCVQNVEDEKPELSIVREDASNMGFEELKSLFVNAKDFPITVYLASLRQGYDPEDIQPFMINDGNDDPFIAIFLEGTIGGAYDDPKEHTEQYNLVNGILIPTVVEWCQDFEGDLEKITAKLRGEIFNKNFLAQIGHRAVLQIMPLEGDIINLGKNELGEIYDWGSLSQRHGYGDAIQEPVKAVSPPAKKGFWSASKKPVAPVVPDATTATSVKDAATPGEHDRSKNSDQKLPAKPVVETSKGGDVAAKVPAWCHKNDDVKMWMKVVSGSIPGHWKKRPPIIVRDFEAAKIDNLIDFRAYALKKTLETTGPKTETAAGKPPAETKEHDAKAISGVAGDPALPIISPKQLEKVLDFVAKHVDTSSKEIIAPTEIQAMEQALPKFSTAVGLTIDELRNWPVNALVGIGKEDLMALVMYAVEWRAYARALETGQPMARETDKSKTTVVKDGGTTKVESVSKEEPPKKKAGFWGVKKVA